MWLSPRPSGYGGGVTKARESTKARGALSGAEEKVSRLTGRHRSERDDSDVGDDDYDDEDYDEPDDEVSGRDGSPPPVGWLRP